MKDRNHEACAPVWIVTKLEKVIWIAMALLGFSFAAIMSSGLFSNFALLPWAERALWWVFAGAIACFVLLFPARARARRILAKSDGLLCLRCRSSLRGIAPDANECVHCPECGYWASVEYIRSHWVKYYTDHWSISSGG